MKIDKAIETMEGLIDYAKDNLNGLADDELESKEIWNNDIKACSMAIEAFKMQKADMLKRAWISVVIIGGIVVNWAGVVMAITLALK